MSSGSSDRFHPENVPVPEPHVLALLVGIVLHRLRPKPLFKTKRLRRAIGLGLIVGGVAIIVQSVRAVGDQTVAAPDHLTISGPFRWTRNPMYLGWTAMYLGIACLLNSVWLILELPAVLLAIHREVRVEERLLERTFAEEYRRYRESVRRYL